MVVDPALVESLRCGERARLSLFVASCTERMAQLFTGLRGVDPGRAEDVGLYLEILEEVWRFGLPGRAFSPRVDVLREFEELQPAEEELVNVDDIYAFYAVLCLRYAVLYRRDGHAESAVRCAHVALTALGQLDRSVARSAFFEEESEFQRRVLLVDMESEHSLLQLRRDDRAAGRTRWLAVNSRLQK